MISERKVNLGMILLFLGVMGVMLNTFDPYLKGKVPSLVSVILISIGFLTAIMKWFEVRSRRKS